MKVFLTISLLVTFTLAEPIGQRYYVERAQEEPFSGYQQSGWKPDGPAFNLPQKQQYTPPAAPQQQYGTPAAIPQQQYGAPAVAPQQQYGAPAAVPQQQYGAPAAMPHQQYGAPVAAPQQQYGSPAAAPQQQYGSPAAAPQQQYGSPAAVPQQQYGEPAAFPQQQYGAPARQQQYDNPVVPQREYGSPDYTTTELPNDDEEPTTVRGLEQNQSEQVNAANELEDDIDARQPQQTGEYYVALPDGRLQRVQYASRQDVEAMKYFAKIRAENVEPLRGPIYAYAPLKRLEAANEKLVEVQPIAQVQYQIENPAKPVPVSSSLTTYTANYQAAPQEQRYILSF